MLFVWYNSYIAYAGVIKITKTEFINSVDLGNRIELNKSKNWNNRYSIITKLILFGTGKYIEENNIKMKDTYLVYENKQNRYVKIILDKVLRAIYIDTEIPEDLFIIFSYLKDNKII